jgi:glycosyltransferase involved in cell wall biosynthesis
MSCRDQRCTNRLRVLHLIVTLGPANAQFNEHCLPMRYERDITICSLHPRTVDVPAEIVVFEGDGTATGFMRALERAFDHGPYDVVHAHAPGTAAAATFVRLRSHRSMSNAIMTVHNSRDSFPIRNQFLLAPLFVAFPTVVFCSRAAARSFPRAMRALARTIDVVPNGVDTERVERVVREHGDRSDRFRVVGVGRLIARKDPATVIDAFQAASEPPDRLLFVGDGVERLDLIDRASSAGLSDQLEITGLVGRDEVYRHLARSSLFVSAARGEGLPVAVLEAMAAGLPVVLSDIPPHREIVDGVGFVPLVRPGDIGGFAAAIRSVKAMPEAERADIGARCRALVERRFSLDAMHRSYERVYRTALTRGGGGRRGSDAEVAA